MAETISSAVEDKYVAYYLAARDVDGLEATRKINEYIEELAKKIWMDQVLSGEPVTRGAKLGHRVPEEMFAKTLIFTKGKKIYDYNGLVQGTAGVLVSQKFKDCCEAIEPGAHQFVPVEVFFKDGTPYGEPYYAFRVITVRNAVNPTLGGVEPIGVPEDWEHGGWQIVSGVRDDKLAVYKDRIEGLAAWRDLRYPAIFFSDAFLQSLDEAGANQGFSKLNTWQEI